MQVYVFVKRDASIGEAAIRATCLADELNHDVVLKFEGDVFIVSPNTTPEEIYCIYENWEYGGI